MTIYVSLDWERDGSAALHIARPGEAVEVILLNRLAVARLLAQGSELWRVVEGAEHPHHHDDHRDVPPHFIGVLGE